MLLLLFELGGDRYALDAADVAEVLPLVSIKRIPRAPVGVAGVFDFRGSPVPAVDLGEMALNRPAAPRLSTRIILVHYPDADGQKRLLGLIAEKVTETVRRERADFVPTGVTSGAARYLGPVTTDPRGLIQRVLVGELLTEPVRRTLFQELGGR
jgi:chemotaxis-related protein WspB